MNRSDKYPNIDTRAPGLYRAVLEAALILRSHRGADRLVEEIRARHGKYQSKRTKHGILWIGPE